MTAGIYKLAFSSGNYYVGQTTDLNKRHKTHLSQLISGKHFNYKLQQEFQALQEVPEFMVVELCEDLSLLNALESKYIDLKTNRKIVEDNLLVRKKSEY